MPGHKTVRLGTSDSTCWVTQVRSHTNVTSVTNISPQLKYWGGICLYTQERSHTNVPFVASSFLLLDCSRQSESEKLYTGSSDSLDFFNRIHTMKQEFTPFSDAHKRGNEVLHFQVMDKYIHLTIFQWMDQYDPKICTYVYILCSFRKRYISVTQDFSDFLYPILKLRCCSLSLGSINTDWMICLQIVIASNMGTLWETFLL